MDGDRPEWWETNAAIRERLDLPTYEPPRFADGTYTYEVVPDLEAEFGVTVRFVGINTRYPDAWTIRVDGEAVAEIERRRDARGNTVYGRTAAEVREIVVDAVDES